MVIEGRPLSTALCAVGFAGGQDGPDDARILGGKCEDCFLVSAPSDQRLGPEAEPIGVLGEHAQRGARSVDEQGSVDIAALGDRPKRDLPPVEY